MHFRIAAVVQSLKFSTSEFFQPRLIDIKFVVAVEHGIRYKNYIAPMCASPRRGGVKKNPFKVK